MDSFLIAFKKIIDIINHPDNKRVHLPPIKRAIYYMEQSFDSYDEYPVHFAQIISEYKKLVNKIENE